MSGPSIWRQARRDAAVLGAGSLTVAVTQLAFRGVLISQLSPENYGRLVLVLSIYNFVLLVGASGLPNAVARYISIIYPKDDTAVVRAAFRAALWPTVLAALVVGTTSAFILESGWAFVYAAIGLSCLVYAVVITGILRGRGSIVPAASIMPAGGLIEVALLGSLILCGVSLTLNMAFAVFCLGNVVGLIVGLVHTRRTSPRRHWHIPAPKNPPAAKDLLTFSIWLGAASVGLAALPLIVRWAAAIDSYATVALVDIALVLLTVPLRIGTVLISAVVPHASKALKKGDHSMVIRRREHIVAIAPFLLLAVIALATPIVPETFQLVGRPGYGRSAVYLSLALMAGPARILYGLVAGVLTAHGDGKFLAVNALGVAVLSSIAILAIAILGSMPVAFGVFVASCWIVYILCFSRINHLYARQDPMLLDSPRPVSATDP